MVESSDNHVEGSPSDATVQKVKNLLDTIRSSKGERRAAAKAELHSISSEAALAIGEMLEARFERKRRDYRFARRMLPWILAYGTFLFIIWLAAMLLRQWPDALCIVLLPGPIIMVAALVIAIRSVYPPPTAWIDTLILLSDKRAVPILLNCYWGIFLGGNVYKILNTLAQLLPLLDESDRSLLSVEQRDQLHRFLAFYEQKDTNFPPELMVSVLKALGNIGDASSIVYVKRVAKTKRDVSVRKAACDCLEAIQNRLDAGGDQLLRATSGTASAELLRTVETRPTTEQGLLLRIAGDGKTGDDG